MDFFNNLINEYAKPFKDFFTWLFASLFGAGIRLAHKSKKQKINYKQVFWSIVTALGVGYMTDNLITYLGYSEIRGFAVALAALLSEGLVQWLFDNEFSIFKDLFQFFLRKYGGEKKEDGE